MFKSLIAVCQGFDEKSLRTLAASANIVSAAGIGIYQVKDALIQQATKHGLLTSSSSADDLFTFTLVACFVLIPISLIFWAMATVGRLSIATLTNEILDFECRPARGDDLQALNVMALREFGERSSGYENIVNIQTHNPECFWVVVTSKVEGYFGICALTKAGERAIAQGYFSGANPAREHIRNNIRLAKSVCVIGVVGRGTRGRGATLSALTTLINSIRCTKVYGRPVSDDGLRIANKFGMEDVRLGGPPIKNNYCFVERKNVENIRSVKAMTNSLAERKEL